MFYHDGYVVAYKGKRKSKYYVHDSFMVKATPQKSKTNFAGCIRVGKIIFPRDMIGKRVKLRIEVAI